LRRTRAAIATGTRTATVAVIALAPATVAGTIGVKMTAAAAGMIGEGMTAAGTIGEGTIGEASGAKSDASLRTYAPISRRSAMPPRRT